MKPFKRSKELKVKQIWDSLTTKVITDVPLTCTFECVYLFYSKKEFAKTFCNNTVIFPNKLKRKHQRYTADLLQLPKKGMVTYWKPYKGTIRDMEGNVIG